MKIYRKKIQRKALYREYVSTLNSLLKLSERELDVLAILISIDLHWPEYDNKNVIDERSRRRIMAETLINKTNLSKYISKLKRRKILITTDNLNWIVNYDFIISPLQNIKESLELIFLLEIENE